MQTGTRKKLPMEGIRVVNLCWYWVGATLSHILSDMGAEVVKVDSYARLEALRNMPPFMHGQAHPDRGYWSHNLHRNAYGITVNLDTQRGRDLLKEVIAHSDILAENWTPGTMKKLGLDYESLRKVRPDLIMVSASAAGQWGPIHRISTFGTVISSMAGLEAVQGYEAEAPVPFGNPIADPTGGLFGAYAVLAALRGRKMTGEGCHLDFSQWEAMATMMGVPLLDYHWNRRVMKPMGNRDPLYAPHNAYPAKGEDSWVCIAVYSDDEWEGLCRAMGNPPWCREERFMDKVRRKRHENELDTLVAEWTKGRDHYETAALLQKEGVPSFPALSVRELYTDPHYQERQSWVEVQHPFGPETIYGVHLKLSETPGAVRSYCPLIGEHNGYIFSDLLGHPERELKELQEQKVVY